MDRSYAQVFTRIWQDEDFRALTGGAQRMYLLLLSQPNLNTAGVLPTQERRWSGLCADSTREDVDRWLDELVKTRFIVIDESEEELLLRSFIRNDELWRVPNMLKSALKCAAGTLSRTLRGTLREELERLPLEQLSGKTADETRALATRVIASLPEPLGEPLSEPLGEPPGTGTGVGEEVSVRTTSLVQTELPPPSAPPRDESKKTKTDKPPEPPRTDVERLCKRLAEHMENNGCLAKDCKVTQGWRDEARRLLDIDGVDLEEARRVLDWCQRDSFWHRNVHSMPTFRKQFSKLRQRAQEAGALPPQHRMSEQITESAPAEFN